MLLAMQMQKREYTVETNECDVTLTRYSQICDFFFFLCCEESGTDCLALVGGTFALGSGPGMVRALLRPLLTM